MLAQDKPQELVLFSSIYDTQTPTACWPLPFRPSTDVDLTIRDQPSDQAANRGPRVAGAVDVAVRVHGVAPRADVAAWIGLGLCKDLDDGAVVALYRLEKGENGGRVDRVGHVPREGVQVSSSSAPLLQLAFALQVVCDARTSSSRPPSGGNSSSADAIPTALAYRDLAMDSYVSVVTGTRACARAASIFADVNSGHLTRTRWTSPAARDAARIIPRTNPRAPDRGDEACAPTVPGAHEERDVRAEHALGSAGENGHGVLWDQWFPHGRRERAGKVVDAAIPF
ncbi:hypothetical protein FOPE_00274 [Fonsecaea pedrosoi]|nr:hypothetical protein FOPE_00274 [Fonsecaea pedrosoi]